MARPKTVRSIALTHARLAVEIAPGATEVRLFKVGVNATENGDFLFDAQSAIDVMAAYQAHGVDKMIDLEHLSLNTESAAFDPDARAWCELAIRNGELWAVNIRWNDDGAERLRSRKQRYVSPYFSHDADGRVLSVINIALTALPATHGTEALVAARITTPTNPRAKLAIGAGMDPKLVEEAMAAITAGDSAKALEILTSMIASAAGAAPAEEPPADDAMAAAMPTPAEEEKQAETMAAVSLLQRLSGKPTIGESVREAQTWHASHLELVSERAKLKAERLALEMGERKANAATLVKLKAETPHTSGLATGKLCQRLIDEPLAEQGARVAALLAAHGGKLPEAPKPPPGSPGGGHAELSARELAMCAEKKLDPAIYAASKASRN